MSNVLVLSFEGFSFSTRQLYEQLLPKLLSRAIVHESLTVQDAMNYISSSWPSIILVTDSVILRDDGRELLGAVADYTQRGHSAIFMGFFASTAEEDDLDMMFSEYFNLSWRVVKTDTYEATIAAPDPNMLRTTTLTKSFEPEAVWLRNVAPAQAIYTSPYQGVSIAYAAMARVGFGTLGYIGDSNFGNDPERLILAMCHLDREEDIESNTQDMEG